VGELDERFGLGFFEDDDYCRRARAAGFRIAIADDVFIHHELSAAFDSLGPRAKQEQFERNRRLFEEKWGPWTPHKYRDLTDAREQAR
jgi:GT2 family glycosyltransferase